MKKCFKILIPLLIVFILVFFFPKQCASGGNCPGCETNVCKCLGYEKQASQTGSWKKICYGITHDCIPSDSPSNEIFYIIAGIIVILLLALFFVSLINKNEKN